MDTVALAIGAAIGMLALLLVYWVMARWPAWKAKVSSWFVSEKAAAAARLQGTLTDYENRIKSLETAGLDQIKADVTALKAKVGI